jgi:eukaryotic-like serine/threonine-protein kinase
LKIKAFLVRLLKRAALAGALLATAALSAVLTMRALLSSQEVNVPSLLDKRMSEASALAGRQQLVVRLEGRRYDPRIALDHVAAQDPPPGAVLKTHRTVRLWLSMGPQRLNVPAVEGESLRSARLKLEQLGLPVEHVVEVDDVAAEGSVIVQRPPAGPADEIRTVALLVSRGSAGIDYVMPDLIGRPAGDMIEVLRRAGLRVADVHYRGYPGVAPGMVLRQTPPAGHRVNPRTTVTLDVSKES